MTPIIYYPFHPFHFRSTPIQTFRRFEWRSSATRIVWIAGRIHWMQGQFQMITEDGIVSRDRGWCEFLVPRPWFVRLLVRPAKPANERRRIRQLNPEIPAPSAPTTGRAACPLHSTLKKCTELTSTQIVGRWAVSIYSSPCSLLGTTMASRLWRCRASCLRPCVRPRPAPARREPAEPQACRAKCRPPKSNRDPHIDDHLASN